MSQHDTAAARDRQQLPRPIGPAPVGIGFIALYLFALTFFWIALLSPGQISLSVRIPQIDPEGGTTAFSWILGIGAIVALLANPVLGRLSDRTRTPWGRRRPWIVGGAVIGAACMVVMGTTQSLVVLAIAWWIAQAGFNGALAAVQAVVADRIPFEQRGRISSLLGISQQIGIFGGIGVVALVQQAAPWLFVVPAVIGVVGLLVFALFYRDRVQPAEGLPPFSVGQFLSSYVVNPHRMPDFSWAWLSRFLFFLGTFVFATYQAFYLREQVGVDPLHVASAILVSTAIGAVLILVSAPLIGAWSDRIGRRKVFVAGAAIAYGIGLVIVIATGNYVGYVIGMSIAAVGNATYAAVDVALVVDVLPNDTDNAKNLGVFNIANTVTHSIATAVAAPLLLIGGTSTHGNYTSLLIGSIVLCLLSAVAIRFVRSVR